jgi:hypothetical protein
MRGGGALVEFVKPGEEGKESETQRIIWKDQAIHLIRPERKWRATRPIAELDRGRLPATLALPFLWQTSIETLQSRYQVSLAKEDADTWLLRLIPIEKAGIPYLSRVYLQLDRQSGLPRRYLLLSADGTTIKDFRVTKARANFPDRPEQLEAPQADGWTVSFAEEFVATWVPRLFKPDLLP